MGLVYDTGPLEGVVFWSPARYSGVSEAPQTLQGQLCPFDVSAKNGGVGGWWCNSTMNLANLWD